MNSLSWLLYGAEVAGNAQGVFVGITIATGMSAIACLAGAGLIISSWPDENDRANNKWLMGKVRPLLQICVTFAVLAAVMPSRNTIMLIAASEVGETVLASPEAQQLGGEAGALAADSLRVLRKFINEQLADGERK